MKSPARTRLGLFLLRTAFQRLPFGLLDSACRPYNTSQLFLQLLEFWRHFQDHHRLVNSSSSRVDSPIRCFARSLCCQFVVFSIRLLPGPYLDTTLEFCILHSPSSTILPSPLNTLFPLPIPDSPTFTNILTFTIYGLTLYAGKFRFPSTLATVRAPSAFLSLDQLLDF